MSDEQVLRLLNSIGKKVFIDYYDVFKNKGLSTDEKIKRLPAEYEYSGSRTRVNCAKRIFESGFQKRALQIVLNARVDELTRKKASELLVREQAEL